MNSFLFIFLFFSIIACVIYLCSKYHLSSKWFGLFLAIMFGMIGWTSYYSRIPYTNQPDQLIKRPVDFVAALFKENGPALNQSISDQVLLDVPIVKQLPELPRGCEVTSLAMLLQYAGVDADKMILARQIKKNPAKMYKMNGQVHYGDPNEGFIGDMYNIHKPGLGVYHTPIKELAERYMPGKIIDFTNGDFTQIKRYLSTNRPIWVIINTAYQKLDSSYFHTWQTSNGEISITYKEHSVVVTGYDQDYIYFNDPLTGKKNRKAPIADFEKAWVQMGRQAITYKD